MKKKCFIFSTTLLLTVVAGLGQDTSGLTARKHLKNNSDTLKSPVNSGIGTANPNPGSGKKHSAVNSNKGTVIPNTTSGTLSSSVNPNTQLVIPIHRSKRKSKSNITPDSGIIRAKQ